MEFLGGGGEEREKSVSAGVRREGRRGEERKEVDESRAAIKGRERVRHSGVAGSSSAPRCPIPSRSS